MAELPISLKVQNYRCFGDVFAGFETIKPINVLIGRNNSGKSALLDIVQAACSAQPAFRSQDSSPGRSTVLEFSKIVTADEARKAFPENTSGGQIKTHNHWVAGQRYVGSKISWRLSNGDRKDARQCAALSVDMSQVYSSPDAQSTYENSLARSMVNPLEGKLFRRLAAERNVLPEMDHPDIDPQPDGKNVTNLIQRFYNWAAMDRSVVEKVLLDELNSVVSPDYRFDEIVLRRLDDTSWEIFLREREKGLIPLSASGSGLKTILCVLATMRLWPIATNRSALESYVFGFEELENSLHPALLRRLLLYVSAQIKKGNGNVFLTTHSSAAIDLFAEDSDAQIIHTTHRPGSETKVATVSAYLHKRDILYDLDVRASDLLQSNGIIWVEGPSDRIYVNHWIRIFGNGELHEGTHYQCVFYGGKVLAHLGADDPEDPEEDLLSIFRVNQNAAVVIDSDRSADGKDINSTKQRVVREMERMQGFAWITSGREIENYLPASAIAWAAEVDYVPELGQFSDLADHLNQLAPGVGRRFERSKPQFAAKAIERLDMDKQRGVLDWLERMSELTRHIRRWNRLPESVT